MLAANHWALQLVILPVIGFSALLFTVLALFIIPKAICSLDSARNVCVLVCLLYIYVCVDVGIAFLDLLQGSRRLPPFNLYIYIYLYVIFILYYSS